MVTRNDVAKLAGVSPAVVSYVLNHSNYVSEEKRRAVLKAVDELGYYPNSAARSLKAGKSQQFMIVSDDIRSELFVEVTYYMEREASKHGYSLAISSSTSENSEAMLDGLFGGQYAGIFFFSSVLPLGKGTVDKLNKLAQLGVPVLLFKFIHSTARFNPQITILQSNMTEAVSKAVDYLIDVKGHQIIGYVGDGNPLDTGETMPFGDGLRVMGYLDSLTKHNIEPKKEYVFFLDEFANSSLTYMNVDGITEHFLSLSPAERPTAYFVNSDSIAAKLMSRFHSLQICTPKDIEIIGFGDTLSASITNPQLTTVALPCQAIGERAIYILMRKIRGEQVGNEHFTARFIKRDSA